MWDWLKQLGDFLTGIAHWFTDWLVGLVRDGWNNLIGQIPTMSLPPWWGDMVGGVGQVMALMGKMSFWVPVGIFLPCVLAVATAFAIALGVRIARIIASFVTLGGGA